MSSIASCTIASIDEAGCKQIVAWLLSDSNAAPEHLGSGLAWVLAHSDDGVTWGRFDEDAGRWHLGHDAFPDVSPPIRAQALQELRVFGNEGEVLIWRAEEGLRGRLIKDAGPAGPRDETDPLRPSEEFRILRGDRVHGDAAGGFTRVTDATGAEQVLPIKLDEARIRQRNVRLHVRHYWVQDADDGTVRVAVTRLVKLTTGERDVG
jgi:CRISPR-associated protein (TIGR03984 family)